MNKLITINIVLTIVLFCLAIYFSVLISNFEQNLEYEVQQETLSFLQEIGFEIEIIE